jgi:transcriptional regulator with XRE-family HTH domain
MRRQAAVAWGRVKKPDSRRQQTRLRALLRQLRIEARLRQADVARRLGEPQSFVSKYESGERRLSFVDVVRVCDALGVPLAEFVRRWEKPE